MNRLTSFRFAQWRMLLATMFCYFFFYTGRHSFGFAMPGIEEELGIHETTLGGIVTALLWSYAIGQAINGNLADKYGGRRLMSLAALLSCGLNWVVSFGSNVATLMVPWAANGYAQSLGWAPGSRVLSNWWSRAERGRVYGMYLFSAGMGSVLAFVLALLVLQFGLSWRWILRLPVLLMLVGGGAYYLLIRDRPEDLGFPPVEDDPADEPDETLEPAPSPGGPNAAAETSRERYLAVLSNWRFMVASTAIGFQSVARYGLLSWVPKHFLGDDWKKVDSPDRWISVALPVGMAVGAVTAGWLSDRLFRSNRSRVISLFMTLAAVASLGMFVLPTSHPAGIPVLFLCGFFAYGPQAAFWALCPDLLGRQRAGTGTGVMNAFAYAFAGLGILYIGWLIETHDHNTALVFPVVAVACLISGFIALFIRR
jgi:OPA family glycerol-3-phosphate transporter-like MFS transporter